jgi:hypothetical protein
MQLKSQYLHPDPDAPVVVTFGGSPQMRHQVVSRLESTGRLTVYGTLSEPEGMGRLSTLPRVDIVIIGGRYTDSQRSRIKAYVALHLPGTLTSGPGRDYPYDEEGMIRDVGKKLGW